MKKVVLDTETTGLDHRSNKIIEIGAIELIDDIPTGKKFHKYINPMMPVSPESYKVHGLSNEFLSNKPTFQDICDEVDKFLSNSTIIAHNAKFDVNFLNKELKLSGKNIIQQDQIICTVKMASKLFPKTRVNLDALCKKFKIDISHRSLHGALKDAELLTQVYSHLQSKIIADSTNLHEITTKTQKFNEAKINFEISNNYNCSVKSPSKEETTLHLNKIKQIKNNLWARYIAD